MDSYMKDLNNETAESFNQRIPFGERTPQNLPYLSHIQELTSILVSKKSELKEAKLRQGNLWEKNENQDVRISKIRISLDHEIEREQLVRAKTDNIHAEINLCK